MCVRERERERERDIKKARRQRLTKRQCNKESQRKRKKIEEMKQW